VLRGEDRAAVVEVLRRGAGAAGRVIRVPEDSGDRAEEGGMVLMVGVGRATERGGRVAGAGLLPAIAEMSKAEFEDQWRIGRLKGVATRAVVYCKRGHEESQGGDHFKFALFTCRRLDDALLWPCNTASGRFKQFLEGRCSLLTRQALVFERCTTEK
jgi:hypothetical protein